MFSCAFARHRYAVSSYIRCQSVLFSTIKQDIFKGMQVIKLFLEGENSLLVKVAVVVIHEISWYTFSSENTTPNLTCRGSFGNECIMLLYFLKNPSIFVGDSSGDCLMMRKKICIWHDMPIEYIIFPRSTVSNWNCKFVYKIRHYCPNSYHNAKPKE